MSKMKEIFLKQIEEQMNNSNCGDEDFQYEQYINQQRQIQIQMDMMNDELDVRYSKSDVESTLNKVFNNFQVSGRLKDEIIEMIMAELINLNNLRNGNTN